METNRIQQSIERHGATFLERIFTEAERAYCDQMKKPEIHYAARFAAKEAVSKSFGTGFGKNLGWNDVEVIRKESGEPQVELSGAGKRFAEQNGIDRVLISLSHSERYAVANAIAMTGS